MICQIGFDMISFNDVPCIRLINYCANTHCQTQNVKLISPIDLGICFAREKKMRFLDLLFNLIFAGVYVFGWVLIVVGLSHDSWIRE